MKDILKLNVKEIYKKDFPIEFKGYSPEEVDKFLDLIISDYQVVEEIINKLIDENKQLKYNIANLEADIIELKAKASFNAKKPEVNNLDILKRLSKLEEIVLKK